MATLALAAGGALLGSSIGIGANLGWIVGSAVGSLLFPEQGPTIEGPRLNDLSVTSSTYGKAIPVVYGTARLAGNVIWSTGLQERRNVDEIGGKGGMAPSQTTITYTYSASFAVALCEGVAQDVLRIWADSKLVYDKTDPEAVDIGKHGLNFRFYNGSETQEPDSLIASSRGTAHSTPAFRGLTYIVFDNLELEDFANRIPSISVELTFNRNALQPVKNAVFFADGEATSFNRSNLLVDYDRGVFYTAQNINGAYLRRFGLRSMVEDRQASYTSDASGGPVGNLDLIALSKSGYIIATTTNGNSAVLSSIDPESLAIVSSLGVESSSLDISPNTFEQIVPGTAVCVRVIGTLGAREFAVVGSIFNSIGIVDITGFQGRMSFIWSSDTAPESSTVAVPPADNSAILGVCEGEPGLGSAAVYVIMGDAYSPASDADVNLYRITIQFSAAYSESGLEGDNYIGVNLELVRSFSPGELIPGETLLSSAGRQVFDKTDNTLLIHALNEAGDEARLIKYDPENDIIVWNSAIPFHRTSVLGQAQARVENGIYGDISTERSYTIDTVMGTIRSDLNAWSPGRFVSDAAIWDSRSLTTLGMNNDEGISRWFFERGGGAGVPLSSVVEDLCARAGITDSEIDVNDLADETVEGYLVGRQTTVRAAIQPLSTIYLFDGIESDYILKFEKRDGKTPVASLTQSDLAIIDSGSEFLKENRTQEIELPVRFSVAYMDTDRDYEQSLHSARRIYGPEPAMRSQNEFSVEYPGALSTNTAKQAAEKLLFSAWIERSSQQMRLPWTHLNLDPGDIVTLTLDDGTVFRSRLTQGGVGVDFSLDVSSVSEEAAQYTSTVEGDNGDSGLVNEFLSDTSTKTILLASPLLRDSDDNGRTVSIMYFFMGGYGQPGWRTGALFKSADATQYDQVGSVVSEMTWGSAVNKLLPPAEGTVFSTDEINTLTVALSATETVPSSCTQLELVNGANYAALIRSDGNPEIIQYRDVTTNSNGTYTLSGLLRGRRGTDVFVDNHQVGDTFVLLSASTGAFFPLAIDEKDLLRYYKGLTSGGLIEEAPEIVKASPLNDLKPYAPVNHKVVSGTWGSDITIEWERRTRVGGGLKANSGTVPLSEDTEEYELDILDGSGTVIRTQTGLTSKSFTYPAAAQAIDFPGGYVNITSALLSNADFEEGTTFAGTTISGWKFGAEGNTIGVVTGASGNIASAHAGVNYLSMNQTSLTNFPEIYQDANVYGYSKAIDEGAVSFRVGAYIASSQASSDTGRIDILFLDENENEISTHVGSELNPNDTGAWTQYTETATAPVGTRLIRVSLNGTRVTSSVGVEVYWDSVSLEVNEGAKKFLNVAVYQMSGQVGRGFAGIKQIEVI